MELKVIMVANEDRPLGSYYIGLSKSGLYYKAPLSANDNMVQPGETVNCSIFSAKRINEYEIDGLMSSMNKRYFR